MKTIHSNFSSALLFVISMSLFFLFSESLIAQNTKSRQWKKSGGEKILSGNLKFTDSWTSSPESRNKGLYWKGDFYRPEKKKNYKAWESYVKNSVAPTLASIIVKGPGNIALYQRCKSGASVIMLDAKTKTSFRPWSNTLSWNGKQWEGQINEFNPAGEFWGKIPENTIMTIQIEAHMTAYNNQNMTGEYAFHAPQEISDYEVWFFPGEGGEVLKVDKHPKIVTATPKKSFNLSGKWNVDQDNGYTGLMELNQSHHKLISGHVVWNGSLNGSIEGELKGQTVEFTVTYSDGVKGIYKGSISSDGQKITRGTVSGTNGISANWKAVKKGISVQNNSTVQAWVIGLYNHIHHSTASAWQEQAGGGIGKDIAVDPQGRPWVIGSDNGIYYFDGNRWLVYPNGKGIAISIAPDGIPWIIGTNNRIYYGTGNAWTEEKGGGIGKDIAIDSQGKPWVIGSDNGIYYFDGNRWIQYPGGGKAHRISLNQ